VGARRAVRLDSGVWIGDILWFPADCAVGTGVWQRRGLGIGMVGEMEEETQLREFRFCASGNKERRGMGMKKIVLILTVLLLVGVGVSAEESKDNTQVQALQEQLIQEKMKALNTEFMWIQERTKNIQREFADLTAQQKGLEDKKKKPEVKKEEKKEQQ
jgi:hypothetical protein